MDTYEEPQKKIFKARKTMKASDRQQLEAVHKAKEELFKPNELKLLNGNHENGDSDISATYHDTEYMEDKTEVNGTIDLNSDSHDIPIVKISDLKEGLKNLDQTKDLKLKLEIQPTVSHSCQENKTSVLVSEGRVEVSTENTEVRCEQNTIFEKKEQTEGDGFPLVKKELPEELSEEKVSVEESHIILEGIHELEEENPEEGENSEESETLKDDLNETVCEQESIDVLKERQESEGENELELDDKKGHSVEGAEHLEDIDGKEILDGLQKENEESDELLQDAKESEEITEEVIVLKQGTSDLTDGPEESEMTSKTVADEEGCTEKGETIDAQTEEQDAGEEAISSSMETDQNINDEEKKSSAIPESNLEKSHSDFPIGSDLESVDTMETDEIIPILEKLAPVEDELQCFSKTALHLEGTVNPDEDKAGNDAASPSKQDNSGTLPSEAFLVLSDEEEPCDEVVLSGQEKTSSPKDASKDFPEEPVENEEEQEMEEHVTELEAERNDVSRRKRSKSEDLDSESSKRPRYEGEEYEAELQVKITAGDDLNKKLQKVIQKMLEEKLNVLQCAVFDKTLTDLKTRVEKIECKKHENILYGIQAKITRLTKRYGAAKEDLKKRPEQTPATQPASPGKPANEATTSSNNTVTYRNASTVRQMLESKRNVGDATTVALQTPATGQQSLPTSSSLPLRTPNTTQMTLSQSSANTSLQGRAPPDWKLIQQRINASSIGTPQNNQTKPSQPVASAQVMTSVIPASSTPTVVGNSQVSASNTQPMSVSLQSLPVILHVPVAMQSQSQLMQGTTGTLVTNQQSGNVEFIPVQNQSTVSNLTKTPQVSLAATKPINSPSMPSSGIQRNSPANSVASTLTVQTIPTTHSVVQSSRPSLPPAGSSGMYSQANNRNSSQIKAPGSGFNSSSSEAPMASRTELQGNRPTTAETTLSKRTAESTTTSGKAGGVIDLTLDEEDPEMTSQDSRRASTSSSLSGNTQSSQIMGRPSQPPQPNTLQSSSASTGIASQATIHVLPTAQTTVNVTQRPGAQISTRATAPRAPNNQQMAYTTTNLPTVPAQTPLRNTAIQNLRQITPQTGGVSVRMPQTTAYVVNNGMPIGSTGPQLTVHHRPPQEPVRPIHPAPLPEAPQPPRLPPEAASTSAPQKPHLKLARVQSQNGIVLSWSVLEVDRSCAIVDSYHLYAYHEDPTATTPSQWKKIGEVKALPLPMACTLTQFVSGSKYYFAVRAKDIYGRFGPFCDPQSTDVISTQNS